MRLTGYPCDGIYAARITDSYSGDSDIYDNTQTHINPDTYNNSNAQTHINPDTYNNSNAQTHINPDTQANEHADTDTETPA